jgi:hypothetical protein
MTTPVIMIRNRPWGTARGPISTSPAWNPERLGILVELETRLLQVLHDSLGELLARIVGDVILGAGAEDRGFCSGQGRC